MMKLEKDLTELMILAEKVSENISVMNIDGNSIVLSNSESVYFKGSAANGDKSESSNFILDKNAISLIKLTDPCAEISLDIQEDKIKFIGGSTKATLPIITEPAKELQIDFKECSIANISEIKRVLYAVATDSLRPILEGVSFKVINESLEITTMDGFRISSISLPLSKFGKMAMLKDGTSFIIAKSDINKLLQISKGAAGIAYDEVNKVVSFVQKQHMVSIKCMDGAFPDFSQILNTAKTPYNVSLDKESLLKELQKCALTNESAVTLNISPKGVKIFSKSNNLEIEGSLRLGIDSNVIDETKISFNLKYLLEVIHAVDNSDEDEINIQYKDGKSLIKRNVEDFQNILLPVADKI